MHYEQEEMASEQLQESEINRPYVLAVEGDDEREVLDRIARNLGIRDSIYIRVLDGRSNLPKKMRVLAAISGFWQNAVALGVIMDAEEDAQSSYQSVCGALYSAKLSLSRERHVAIPDGPNLYVLILPGDNRPGSLETICLDSVRSKTVMTCANGFSKCVEEEWTQEHRPTVAKLHKMKAHAFLSTIYEKPEIRLGEAAGKGVGWDLNHKAFNQIREFLTQLVEPSR